MDLKQSIKTHLTGRILLNVKFMEKNFDIEFLSGVSELFVKR